VNRPSLKTPFGVSECYGDISPTGRHFFAVYLIFLT
jgi:hypothetical protein